MISRPARSLCSRARDFACLVALAAAACSHRPAIFADRDPVEQVQDELPIPVPVGHVLIKPLYYSDAYVRLTISDALDPSAPTPAGDVHALDEVAGSSWFDSARSPADTSAYHRDGPPVEPLRARIESAPSENDHVRAAVDARGLPYEMLPDLEQAPEMRTASAVIASRLMFALGYRTPEVWIAQDPRGRRIAAMRWPAGDAGGVQAPGLDLGPTRTGNRFDDPFDVLPHENRRSLRGLAVAMAWLDIDKLRPGTLRDVYVGPEGLGHVEHHIVWLEEGLGVGAYIDATEDRDPTRVGGSVLHNFLMLGFAPRPTRDPSIPYASVGIFDAELDPDRFKIRPPFAPFLEMQAPDLYWMSKRIAAVPLPTIEQAVAAAKLSDATAARYLVETISARQRAIARWGFGLTTPCELADPLPFVRPRSPDGSLRIPIEDASLRLAPAGRYWVGWLDSEGDEVAGASEAHFKQGRTAITVPKRLLDAHPYLIVQLTRVRGESVAPRSCEIHLRHSAGGVRIAGLRH